MVLGQLELLRALAENNEREQQLGSLNAYAYPQSLGEWLGTAVQLAGSVSWQTHYALRPLDTHADHERGIAEQGRGMIELYGAVLVGALGACDTALEREVSPELEVELPEVESVLECGMKRARSATAWCSRSGRSRGDLDLRHLPRPRRRAATDRGDEAARGRRVRGAPRSRSRRGIGRVHHPSGGGRRRHDAGVRRAPCAYAARSRPDAASRRQWPAHAGRDGSLNGLRAGSHNRTVIRPTFYIRNGTDALDRGRRRPPRHARSRSNPTGCAASLGTFALPDLGACSPDPDWSKHVFR